MSLVNEEHWKFWLGDMPMPEGATFEMMWAARDVIDNISDIEYALEMIQEYSAIEKDWQPRWVYVQKQRHLGGKHEEEYQNVKKIIQAIKEIIEFHRERLQHG